MDRQRAKELLERYRLGRCTDDERRQVEGWYLHVIDANQDDSDLAEADYALIDLRLRNHLPLVRDRKVSGIVKFIPYAAAAILVVVVGLWTLIDDQTPNRLGESAGKTLNVEDIVPGTNRATLTLADGRTIDLSEAQTGIVVGAEDITYADGSALDVMSSVAKGRQDISLLELTTPKGGTYSIALPDGSRVWLNSASRLRYPSRFSSDSREVILEGEAFFEIKEQMTKAQERVPFYVQTTGQTVQVLGTQFNVSAYTDEPETKTTLVAGAVQIVNLQANIVKKLRPGQQSKVRGPVTETYEVEVQKDIAWKDGRFYFSHTPFEDLMRQMARWYDVEIVYQGKIPNETFSGEMSRDLTLGAALNLLNVSAVHVQVAAEGNRLVVH